MEGRWRWRESGVEGGGRGREMVEGGEKWRDGGVWSEGECGRRKMKTVKKGADVGWNEDN